VVIEDPWKGDVDLLDAKYEGQKALYTWKAVYQSGRQSDFQVSVRNRNRNPDYRTNFPVSLSINFCQIINKFRKKNSSKMGLSGKNRQFLAFWEQFADTIF
jgi:hypothetical protein